jgi:hypothetical protein
MAAGGRGVVLQLRRSRFLTASASVGTFSRGRNRSAWRRILRQETEVASNRDVELNLNFNYDRTTPGKGP